MNKKKIIMLWAVLAVSAYGEQSVNLDKTVVYSSTGFETELRKTASNPTLVTAGEIKEKNYKTVEEVLEDIPAVNIVRQGKDYVIDLRGQGEKAKQNVQLLVDGVPMNSLDTSMSATPVNTISPEDIERIEVLPGGGSVLYGSGTAGGVINIITKKGTGFRINGGAEYGSYANKKLNFALGQSFGNFDVNLSYINIDRQGYRDGDTSNSDNFTGNIRYRINEKQDLTFKYSRYEADDTYPDMLTKKELEEDRTQSGLGTGEYNETKTNKDEYVLIYNNKISNNLDFSVTSFHQETITDTESNTAVGAGMYMAQVSTFEDKKSGIKPKFKYSYGEGSSFIFGMDYIKNEALRNSESKNSTTINDLEKETMSTYAMNNYVWKNFEFAQGIRYEKANYDVGRNTIKSGEGKNTPIYVTTDEENLAYELSANWLYSDTGKSYIRYEKGFTSPPPSLLTDKINYTEYVLNDLKSEKYDNFEIGLSDFAGITSVNASVFYTITKDEITQEMSKGLPVEKITNYNLGKTERYGIEIKTGQYFDKLTLSQSYSYINTEIKEGKLYNTVLSGNKVANVPEHKINLGAGYSFTDNFSLSGEIVYMSGVYMNNQNQGGKINSHTVTNIRARYAFENGLDIYGGINNLFNRKYYEDVDYNISTKEYSYDPAAERNYYIGFKYTF